MTVRVVAAALVLTMIAAACTDDVKSTAPTTTSPLRASTTSSTVPERSASTTTTAFDPASVEGQVEAAYLRSWDVYAEAVYHLQLDEEAFAQVYAGEALELRRNEVSRRIVDRQPSRVRVEHDYSIVRGADPSTASVIDNFVNHQVRLDPETMEPTEADPNELLLVNFKLTLVGGIWKVTFIQKVVA